MAKHKKVAGDWQTTQRELLGAAHISPCRVKRVLEIAGKHAGAAYVWVKGSIEDAIHLVPMCTSKALRKRGAIEYIRNVWEQIIANTQISMKKLKQVLHHNNLRHPHTDRDICLKIFRAGLILLTCV